MKHTDMCVCVTAFVHARVCMCVRFVPPYVRASVYGTQLHLSPQTHAQLPNESARITASPSPPPPSFRDQQLEVAYQRYSHRQRQKSLIMVNGVDLVLKVVLLIIFLVNSTGKTNDHVVVCMRWCLLCFLEEVGLQ